MGIRLEDHSFCSFHAAEEFWRAAHATEAPKPAAPSAEAFDELVAKYG